MAARRPKLNIEDRRGQSVFGGGGIGFRGLGLGGTVILLILSLVFGKNFFSLLGSSGSSAGYSDGTSAPAQSTPEEDRLVSFVSFVLDSTQSFWGSALQGSGAQYHPAKLVLFRDAVQSACGMAETATGPFYCPSDEKVYIDLSFYQELKSRFGAPGDFAQAYVIAHELGHHVQHLLGYDAQQGGPAKGANGSWSGWSCRPIALRVCGVTMRRSRGYSSQAMPKKVSMRRPR